MTYDIQFEDLKIQFGERTVVEAFDLKVKSGEKY